MTATTGSKPQDAAEVFLEKMLVFKRDLDDAIESFFAWHAIYLSLEDLPNALKKLNHNPHIWNRCLDGLFSSSVIALGRLLDSNTNNHRAMGVAAYAIKHAWLFKREELKKRKLKTIGEPPDYLEEYIREAYEPTKIDLGQLQQMVKDCNKLYQSKFRNIRSLVYAHSVEISPADVQRLFSEANSDELREILGKLMVVYGSLWELYINGRKPSLVPLEVSTQDLIDKAKRGELVIVRSHFQCDLIVKQAWDLIRSLED